MSADTNGPGLRPEVPPACREYLRARLDGVQGRSLEHGEVCESCRAHTTAALVLAEAMRRRPLGPSELGSAALLEGVFDRVLRLVEAGPVAAELVRLMPTPPAAEVAETPPLLLESPLAGVLSVAPPRQSASAWTAMRDSILAGASVEQRRLVTFRLRWMLTAFGVASAAVAITLALMDGMRHGASISFMDLKSMPSVEFAIVRHGALR